MSDIPSFPYAIVWEERQMISVANLTRADAREFFGVVPEIVRAGKLKIETRRYPLSEANAALADLRSGKLQGAAVLCV